MPAAYTPGLRVTPSAVIRKTRRLSSKGDVLVEVGQKVQGDTVVARAALPGNLLNVKVARQLGIEPSELTSVMLKREGDAVQAGDVIAETRSFFGVFRSRSTSPVAGKIENVSAVSGQVGVREPPVMIEVSAYVEGEVVAVIPQEGAEIETRGAFIQGIFGVGGERRGALRMAAAGPDAPMCLNGAGDVKGAVLVGGATCSADDLLRVADMGAVGVVVGGIGDDELRRFLGYDLGVAITGHEKVPLTLILTEGFGNLAIAQRTWRLLESLEGKQASISGATQIRAGVIRPEIIVPLQEVEVRTCAAGQSEAQLEQELAVGARVRVIREPHFGALGQVSALPPELQRIETEAMVRVAEVGLDSGQRIAVPRANLEIVQQR
jgi:hypothetical protein